MAQQLLAAPKVQLKAKMMQKSATRPEEIILDAGSVTNPSSVLLGFVTNPSSAACQGL